MSTPTLQDAIALARRAHAGQVDKAGKDYIEHPLRVMAGVRGNDAKITAVLHDVLEDTPVTPQHLREQGYGEHIIEALQALTKQPDEEGTDAGYEKFIRRAGQNPLARKVKIADLQDNSHMSRIANPTEQDWERKARYGRALHALGAGRKANVVMGKQEKFVGRVIGNHFHVDDHIRNGVSQAGSNAAPRYKPIPLSEIRGQGHRIEYK